MDTLEIQSLYDPLAIPLPKVIEGRDTIEQVYIVTVAEVLALSAPPPPGPSMETLLNQDW